MFSLYLDRPARAVLYIVSLTKTRENGTKAAQPVAVCLSFVVWVWFSDKMKAELFTVEVLDVAFICQDVICSRATHKAQTKCWCESKTWITAQKRQFLFICPPNSVAVGDEHWYCCVWWETGSLHWLQRSECVFGFVLVLLVAVRFKVVRSQTRETVFLVCHVLSPLHTSFLLLPSWTSTVTRSHRLPLTLYEWWPFPGLDRKEDRSHLNSAMPPLLNQTPQC